MKNHDVKKKLRNAYSKIETPDVLNSVLNDSQTQKGYVYMENKKFNWKPGLAFALASVLMVGGLSAMNQYNSNLVTSTIAFDVNPSIELEMNKKEKVLKVNTLNEDAKVVLDGMDLVGSDMDVAVNALIGSMIKHGYINDLTNSILVSVNTNDQATTDRLQKELMEEINELIKDNNLTGSVLSQKIQLDDEEIDELATVYGITKGKTQLIKEILKSNPYHSFEDLVDLSINELNLISQPKQETMENVSISGTASDKKYIGTQKAKEIALSNAKLKENQVVDLDVELDYEMGMMVYEVDFEYNNKDYDYDIKATDGSILHVKKEEEPVKNDKPVETVKPTEYIGKEKAKSIALTHAKVNESQVNGLWIEMDKDDGQVIYEVEFNVGNKEYNYEISATTGKIVDSEVEYDDDAVENNSSTSTSSTTGISKDKAKSIALANANVKASEISQFESELDEGKYEISFNVGNTEYSYEISAKDGKILDKEVEEDDDVVVNNSSASTPSTTGISKEKAKSIALANANVKASEITEYEIELDDGKYEISFNVGNTEYSYEISAKDGKILDKEVEKDDDVVANKPSTSTPSTTGISKEKAKSIALADANVKASEITEYEIELDDGKYEISFNVGNTEYSYEISAKDGKILDKEVEKDDDVVANKPSTSTPSTTGISKEKAKSIALADANVKASEITEYEIELDDGKYEISFNVGNTEYSYEISAKDGKILDKEVEKDDDVVANKPSTTGISKEEAKSIALADANVKASEITEYEIELDDGKYEISFNVGNTEYSYEISAKDGKILDKEVEKD